MRSILNGLAACACVMVLIMVIPQLIAIPLVNWVMVISMAAIMWIATGWLGF